MVPTFRRITIAGLALGVALPIMASAQDINLPGGSELIYKGTNVNARSGASVDAGDISGDGRRDLVVGAPGTIGVPGAVYIIYGGPERTGELSLSTADVRITSAQADSFFGVATAIGNVTGGPSTANLAIGAPGALGGRGAVYLYASGWGAGASLTTADAIYTVLGAPGDQLGAGLAIGDLDNDGVDELIIGAKGNGRVYIIKGSSTLSGTLDLSTQAASVRLDLTGSDLVLTAGDITGDGISDLLVGDPVHNRVLGYVGTSGTIPTAPLIAFAGISTAGDAAGTAVRLLDLDGDGNNDIAIGAPGADGPDNARSSAGSVYVFFGPIAKPAGPTAYNLSTAQVIIYGAAAGHRAGERLATGDINRDRPDDLVIFSSGAASGAGELEIYYGRDRSSIGTASGSARLVDFATAGQVSRRIVSDPGLGVIADALVYEVTPAGGRAVIVGVPGINVPNIGENTGKVFFTASTRGPGWTPSDPNPTGPGGPPAPTPTADTRIALNRTGLYFGGTNNGALLSSTQTASVMFTNGSGSWSVATTASWLTISPAAGIGSASFSVSVNPGSYANGSVRTGTITVTAPGVPNSPISIPVQLTIIASPTAPGGYMETPVDNITGVTGSIAVTGWAMDDIGINEVSIWRDPMPGEPGSAQNGKVYIGTATRIDGARPDVDGQFAQPFDYMAGWGYLMLTNMLPNQGNGTFVLHAYATDPDGHTTELLPSKIITGDNAHASRPFGAIDTPGQGETISGSSYVNFGWVLGAQDNVIPTTGETITVFIDGVPVGHPQYNFARDDIQRLFPGHANTNGAIGFYVLDTTRLSNGVHTIAWGATDTAGHSEGIGSRFFTVLNSSSSSVMTTPALVQGSNGTEPVTRVQASAGSETGQPTASLQAIPSSDVPSYAQRGFAMNAPLEILETSPTGAPTLTIEEVGVVRATVGAPVDETGSYEGYFVKGDLLEKLPAGAFLDAKTGEFFWQPAVGFVGAYEFVFIRTANGVRERIPLSIVIEPGGRAQGTFLPSRIIR